MVVPVIVGVVSGILGAVIGFGLAACLTSGKVADLDAAAYHWEVQCRWLQTINDDLRAKMGHQKADQPQESAT